MTRAKRASPTPSAATDDDQDDDQDDDDLALDEELELFIRRPPLGADHVLVIAQGHHGDQVVQDRTAIEAQRAPLQMTRSIVAACQRWASVDGRTTKFRATWMRADRVLSAHQWQAGDGKDPTALDGTVESFLVQQQRFAEAQHRLHLEGFGMIQDGWKGLFVVQNKRIEALETDNAELRDRLRKVDDVGTEIALEQARAEVDARGRTADLIEKRLLPVAQALLLQQAARVQPAANGGDEPAAASPPTPAAHKENS